jgi:hypothetical protein
MPRRRSRYIHERCTHLNDECFRICRQKPFVASIALSHSTSTPFNNNFSLSPFLAILNTYFLTPFELEDGTLAARERKKERDKSHPIEDIRKIDKL